MITLKELLLLPPNELMKLSSSELDTILAPYYEDSRKPLLPPKKPEKHGLDYRLIAAYIEANKDKLGLKI